MAARITALSLRNECLHVAEMETKHNVAAAAAPGKDAFSIASQQSPASSLWWWHRRDREMHTLQDWDNTWLFFRTPPTILPRSVSSSTNNHFGVIAHVAGVDYYYSSSFTIPNFADGINVHTSQGTSTRDA
jgi:hypothetical protein